MRMCGSFSFDCSEIDERVSCSYSVPSDQEPRMAVSTPNTNSVPMIDFIDAAISNNTLRERIGELCVCLMNDQGRGGVLHPVQRDQIYGITADMPIRLMVDLLLKVGDIFLELAFDDDEIHVLHMLSERGFLVNQKEICLLFDDLREIISPGMGLWYPYHSVQRTEGYTILNAMSLHETTRGFSPNEYDYLLQLINQMERDLVHDSYIDTDEEFLQDLLWESED